MFQAILNFVYATFTTIFEAVWAFARSIWYDHIIPLVQEHGLNALVAFLKLYGYSTTQLPIPA